MTSLKENLAELSDSLPQMRDEATKATGLAHALADTAGALLQEIHGARDDMAAALTLARDAAPALEVEIEALQKQLDAAITSVQQAWTQAHDALDAAGQALHTAGGQLAPKPGAVETALSLSGSKIDQAAVEGSSTFERLVATVHDGTGRLHAGAAAGVTEMTSLHGQIGHTQADLQTAAQGLLDRFEQLAVARLQDGTELAETLSQRQKEFETNVETPILALGEAAGELENGWEDHLQQALTAPLTTASDGVRATLDQLARDAGQHETVVREHGVAAQAALTALEQVGDRLPMGISQIQEAVEKLRAQ